MKRLLKYLVALLIVLVCVYGFWAWLQYKGATVIQNKTTAVITELHTIATLTTASQKISKTIAGEQELSNLHPDIGVDEILTSALFTDKMILELVGEVSAGYVFTPISENDISVSRDGTVTIVLGEPEIFGVELTGEKKSTQLSITTQKDIDLEQLLREKAGEMMIQEALSGGILQKAKSNAQLLIQDVLLKAQIQIKEVIISAPKHME